MATPILKDLRDAFPKAKITVLCRKPLSDLLSEEPHIDEVFVFSKYSIFSRRNEQRDIVKKLKEGNYDLGILLTNSFSSAWMFFEGGIKCRIGFKGDFLRSLFLTKSLATPKDANKMHLVDLYKRLLSLIGIPKSTTKPSLYLTKDEIEQAKETLIHKGIPENAKIVGINPGAAYGSAKCWLPERFKEVAKQLTELDNVYVIFFGDNNQKPLVDDICKGLGPKVLNFATETTLRELATYLKCCSVLLTNDSGPMHMADALGIPVVALFGSTSDVMTGPYNKGLVIHKHVSCSPCFKRVCPIDFRCMKNIKTDEVLDAIMKIVNSTFQKLSIF